MVQIPKSVFNANSNDVLLSVLKFLKHIHRKRHIKSKKPQNTVVPPQNIVVPPHSTPQIINKTINEVKKQEVLPAVPLVDPNKLLITLPQPGEFTSIDSSGNIQVTPQHHIEHILDQASLADKSANELSEVVGQLEKEKVKNQHQQDTTAQLLEHAKNQMQYKVAIERHKADVFQKAIVEDLKPVYKIIFDSTITLAGKDYMKKEDMIKKLLDHQLFKNI